MNSNYSFLSVDGFTLPYRIHGSGPELLIAFHGFGRSGQDFEPLSTLLETRYTCILVDFFYHGPSALPVEEELLYFTSAHLASFVEKIMWEFKKVKVTLVGCSLGGKLILGLMQRIPHRIEEAYLLAPDGFTADRARLFATHTLLGRLLAKGAVNNPGFVVQLLGIARTFGLVEKKAADFIRNQLGNAENRLRIWRTWQLLHDFQVNFGLIAHYVRSKRFMVTVVVGEKDTITPVNQKLKRFVSKLGRFGKLELVDGGHAVLNHSEKIAALILAPKKNKEKITEEASL